MLGSKTGRVREIARLLLGGASAAAILACAATTATQSQPQADTIADVRVERDGDATIVKLVGPDHPVFTAFEQTEPERVVVDLASVRPGGESEEILVGDGLVDSVVLSPFDTGLGDAMTRVEVMLTEEASYKVLPGPDGVEIRLAPAGAEDLADADAGMDGMDDPWAVDDLTAEDDAEVGFEEAELLTPVEDATPAAPASELSGVEAEAAGEGTLVVLRADGSLDAESFTLEDPARLVVDLPGVASRVAKTAMEVESPQVERVRVGVHSDRVRVVMDGSSPEAFSTRRMIPTSSGLLVALGAGAALEQAVTAALGTTPALEEQPLDSFDGEAGGELAAAGDEDAGWASDWEDAGSDANAEAGSDDFEVADEDLEPAGMADESAPSATPDGPVTIYGLDYDVQDGQDRLVVMGEHPFDYLVYEPDPETVVLSIERAVIDPEVTERIAPAPGGPISLITAFAQPDVRTPEVRVVVKRAAGLKPAVSRRGSLLVVDFPRDGGVAEVPPVFQTGESQTLAASAPAQSAAPATAAATPVPASAPAAQPASFTPAGPQAGSEAVPASLEPPASIAILEEGGLFDGKEYTGRRISLDFKEVEIADVLRLIAEVSDLNVIAGDEVNGRVTIRLVDVPWDQALDVILLTKNLGFMRVGNVLRIAPSDVIKQEEELRLQERRAKEKLEDLVVKLQPVNYANVKDVERMVKKLLSARGSVNIDQRTNTVIIKDIPSVIDEATALVKAIDTQTPQVMIEAKIVEANLDFSREFGSTWSFGAQPLTDAYDTGSPQRQDLGNDFFRLHNSDGSDFFGNNAQFINPITAGPTSLFNLAGFILDEKLNVELQLQAAEVNGDGKVISSPRVVTLDNSKAEIEQGVSIPFQTFENGDAQLEFVDAVLKLAVTPHITADKSIIMDVQVSRNAPDDSVFTATGSPAIAKNEVQTETLVKDGQTLVLGGIYVVDKSNRQSRVPYLHRIPLLGAAFRSDEISDSRKELLIFVTPHIVVAPQAS